LCTRYREENYFDLIEVCNKWWKREVRDKKKVDFLKREYLYHDSPYKTVAEKEKENKELN